MPYHTEAPLPRTTRFHFFQDRVEQYLIYWAYDTGGKLDGRFAPMNANVERAREMMDIDPERFQDRELGGLFKIAMDHLRSTGELIREAVDLPLYLRGDGGSHDEAAVLRHLVARCLGAFLVDKPKFELVMRFVQEYGYLRSQPVTLAPLHEYPAEIWPTAALDLMRSSEASCRTPIDYQAMFAMGCVAALASRRQVWTEWKSGTSEPANCYALTVGVPSEHKSTACSQMTRALRKIEAEWREDRDKQVGALEDELHEVEAQIEKLRKSGSTDREKLRKRRDLKKELKKTTRLLYEDITPETLCSNMSRTGEPGAMAMITAEPTPFDNMMGRYSKTQAGQQGPYKAFWGCETIIRDRAGIEEHATGLLVIAAFCQKTSLRSAVEDIQNVRGSGVLSRFLFSVPRSLVGDRPQDEVGLNPAADAKWEALLRAICTRTKTNLELSAEARAALTEWRNEVERKMAHDDLDDWLGKAQAGQVVRLAGILHCAWEASSGSDSNIVSGETMGRAITLMRYYLTHARMAFDEMKKSDLDDRVQKVVRWLKGGCANASTISRKFNWPKKDQYMPVLEKGVKDEILFLDEKTKKYGVSKRWLTPETMPKPIKSEKVEQQEDMTLPAVQTKPFKPELPIDALPQSSRQMLYKSIKDFADKQAAACSMLNPMKAVQEPEDDEFLNNVGKMPA